MIIAICILDYLWSIAPYFLPKYVGYLTHLPNLVYLQTAVVTDCTAGNTALRLARATNTTPEFWLNLQTHYDLETAKDELGDSLEKEVTLVNPA